MNKPGLKINFAATRSFEECDYYFKLTLRHAILAALEYEGFPADAEVSVTLCDNEYIQQLNKQYREKDKPTDVLSFPMYDCGEFDEIECRDGAVLGDIVISIERAKEQAKEVGNTFHHEVAFLTVHSVLHLLGYDHERSPEDEEDQCQRQRAIIENVDI